ncbi:MAG: thiamine-binding protein [Candidatus Delongbacteria bacterium]|nr:thiamine-binding protein [Candidatus Delongbacteria bacterium]
MIITAEISYYPLIDNYAAAVKEFLAEIDKSGIDFEVGTMSTLITGEYDNVMELLAAKIEPMLEKYPSVFTLKISNSCGKK